jgi:hypothetical protein
MAERDFQLAVRHAVEGGLLERTKQNGNPGLSPKHRNVN